MTEYFYTSLLGYADFAVKHGFENPQTIYWNSKEQKEEVYNDIGIGGDVMRYQFPKTPHNEALMELQHNDLFLYQCEIDDKIYSWNYSIDGVRPQTNNPIIIIQRNIGGKPYPFPVWDKEGVLCQITKL